LIQRIHGEVWHKKRDQNGVVKVEPGDCIRIPTGTQLRWINSSKLFF